MVNIKDIIDIVALIAFYILIFYKKWKAKGKDVLIINTTMYIYLSFVMYFTLMPIITSLPFIFTHQYIPMTLEPFIDVTYGRGDFVRQIVLNIIMTIPFGFLFPLMSPKSRFLKTVFFTLLLSLSIELIQPLLSASRSSDITDVITNVIGGGIGYMICLVFRPLTNKILDYFRKEPKIPAKNGLTNEFRKD